MRQIIAKAGILIEALPYIQRFRGSVVVVKFGGSAMDDKAQFESTLADVAFMECAGMLPVVVHGGGKAISRRLKESGIETKFVRGLRVTDADAMRVVRRVLRNEVNPELVKTIERHGGRARRLDGENLFTVTRRREKDSETGRMLDWGFVGDLRAVKTAAVKACLRKNVIPVITPLGRGSDGCVYNINADEAASAVAKAMKARKLVFLSDVPGLLSDRNDPGSVISTLKIGEVGKLVRNRTIDGGMLPKVHGCVDALKAGVQKIHMIDGRLPHSLLLEIFTDKGVGTEIVHDD